MQQFYQNLEAFAPITKAEALRQAQLSLIKGTSVKQNSEQRGLLPVRVDNPRNQKVYAGNQHPYYCAPNFH